MKKVLFQTAGGFPLVLDDLNFLQDAFFDQLQLLNSAINGTSMPTIIVSGCEISYPSPTQLENTAGVIMHNGILYPVDAAIITAPTVGQVAFWALDNSFDPAGGKVFQDSSSHDVFQVTKGKIKVVSSVPGGYYSIDDAVSLADAWRSVLNNQSWTLFTSPNSDSFYGPGMTPDAVKRRFIKSVDGFVHMKGEYHVDDISTPTNLVIGNLPIGYRPPHNIDFVVLSNQATPMTFDVRVETSGNVRILNAEGNTLFKLNSIPPFSINS